MNAIRWTIAGLLLVASALLASVNFSYADAPAMQAQDLPPPPPSPSGLAGAHHMGPGHLFDKLGLSAEQKQSVDGIMAAKRPALASLHEQMHANMVRLHQTSPDDPNYSAVVSQASQSNSSLMAQAITAEGDMRAQIFAVLTPAQKTQLTALEAKMWAHMKEHGKHRWGHGSPPDAP